MFLRTMRCLPLGFLALVWGLGLSTAGAADQPPSQTIHIGYVGQVKPKGDLPDYLDPPPSDEGVQGARVAVMDNNTTGRFTGQKFELQDTTIPEGGDAVDAAKKLLQSGLKLIVVNLPAEELLKIAALPEAADATLINAGSADDGLRAGQCRRNVLHTLPSNAMLSDALAQYMVAKRWRNLLLAAGPAPEDKAFADAVRYSAKKFQLKIIADKPWTFDPGARRTDTGHYDVQGEVASFTQGIEYDVLIVADTGQAFGDNMAFRTSLPRPVAGTQGVTPTAWARPFEQWGATQMQNRFIKQSKRWMTDRDYAAWMAVRAVGEAATRTQTGDAKTIGDYLRSDKFELAAYKGLSLSFRPWDGQMRQPVLLVDSRSLVSVSPQRGFLHPVSELDTLGIDKPETKCVLK